MAEEEKDDWLDDPEEEASEELDQSDIDSLLSGDDSPAPAAAPATPAETAPVDEDELDQSDIDALLSGDDSAVTEAAPVAEEVDEDELDQSDIDALLSGGDAPAPAVASAPDPEDEAGELDQSDIDALLSGDPTPEQDDAADLSPDQEEIDRLFSEIDDDPEEPDPFQAEEIDFEDILSEEEEGDESFLSTGNEFAEDEFDLDDDIPDIPDIPDTAVDDDETTVFEAREEETSTPVSSDMPQDGGVNSDAEGPKSIDFSKFKLPIAIPVYLQDRKNQGIAAGCIVLLIVLSVFLFSGDGEEAQIAEDPSDDKQIEQPAEPVQPPPVEVVNTAPEVSDQEYILNKNEAAAIILTAQDAEGDELFYEVLTQPKHGKLNGQAPNLVYIPNPDFPGNDRFDFRVNDGKKFSPPVLASIIGQMVAAQPLAPPEKSEPKKIEPRRLVISAQNFSYSVTGTNNLFIDWENIWNEANYLPYSHQVAVEVLTDVELGKLKKISNRMHRYNAKKYFGGQETIRYRFKLGKLKSKIKEIKLTVNTGNPAPEIRMQEIAKSYQPGEMVMLDASGSRDDDRNSLLFSWQQLTGVPVQLEVMNQEGSVVSFMMPSSFSSSVSPGPMMRLTAIDKTGKTDIAEIKILTKSRYKSALWGGLADRRMY